MGAEAVARNAYWAKTPFKWDGGMLFLVGTFLGSLLSVMAGRSFRWEKVPAAWVERFGSSPARRGTPSVLWRNDSDVRRPHGGGCTSGHGISGSLQLALSSWTFFLALFASGAATALVLFRRRDPSCGPSTSTP